MGILTNIRLRGLKDVLNPRKWWIFIVSHFRGAATPHDVTLAQAEQTVYRTILCSSCLKNGSCLSCGCPMPDAIVTPENYCSEGLWDEMLSPEDWATFKADNKINFKIR